METMLDQAAKVLEGALSEKSEDQVFATYIAINLDQMMEANWVMNKNINGWEQDVIDVYNERISNYEVINESLVAWKDGKQTDAISTSGVMAASSNYESVKAEFMTVFDGDDEEEKKRVFEGILLPHYMVMRFLFGVSTKAS